MKKKKNKENKNGVHFTQLAQILSRLPLYPADTTDMRAFLSFSPARQRGTDAVITFFKNTKGFENFPALLCAEFV